VVVTLAVTRREEPAADAALEEAYEAALDTPQRRIADLTSSNQPFTADAVVLADGTGYLAVDALPRLSDDETWQLWGVYVDDDVISLGVLGNQPTLAAFTAEDDVVALVITREAAGGVVSSTSGAVLVGELS
jgi:anti-sigma-K factor RskA